MSDKKVLILQELLREQISTAVGDVNDILNRKAQLLNVNDTLNKKSTAVKNQWQILFD